MDDLFRLSNYVHANETETAVLYRNLRVQDVVGTHQRTSERKHPSVDAQ